ncbi:MAG: hypothetical protein ABI650_04725 [Dokdonella sp.]
MRLRRPAIALIGLCPLFVAAQSTLPAPTAELRVLQMDELLGRESSGTIPGSDAQVVPLWASQDGRLLAIVGLANGDNAPTLPPSPAFGGLSDLRIIDATNLFSTGLRWRAGSGLRADVVVGVQAGGDASNSPFAMLACADAVCMPGAQAYLPGVISATLGGGWTSANSGVDLSFGLSWLQSRNNAAGLIAPGLLAGTAALDPGSFAMPGLQALRLDEGTQVSARGTWQLDRGSMVDVTAGLARLQLAPFWYGAAGGSFEVNQASLGLAIANGSLRGSVVGRVISADEQLNVLGSRRWSGLDLGVSWRTPWRGEVSVGAQNLWSAPLDSSPARDADSIQSRMPYVQYRQDL